MVGGVVIVLSHVFKNFIYSQPEEEQKSFFVKIVEGLRSFSQEKPPLSVIYHMADDLLKDIPEDARKHIPCKVGCSNCCHMDVACCEEEGRLAVDFARRHGIDIDTRRLVMQSEIACDDRWTGLSKEDARCVFLDDDGSCAIYPVRPLNCRSALTFDVLPEKCCLHGSDEQQNFFVFAPVELLKAAYHSAMIREDQTQQNFSYWVLKHHDPATFATATRSHTV